MIRKGRISDHTKKVTKADLNKVALAGILEKKTYPDGPLVGYIGYLNEYGYSGMIPGRTQTVYKSFNHRRGEYNQGGRFVKKSRSNFEEVVNVPSYKLTIPARSFFRTSIEDSAGDAMIALRNSILKNEGVDTALLKAADVIKKEIVGNIMTWTDPPNAPSTIRSKGYNAPLRGNDRLLRNSISTALVNGDSDD